MKGTIKTGKKTCKKFLRLSDAIEGQDVVINCVNCEHGLKKRLCDLGLFDGTRIKVLKNDRFSPIVVGVFDSKLAIRRQQAESITVC